MFDVIIIGSGPAGLSAAIYAGRARLHTLIIEERPMSGGQIINTSEVDNYPGLPGIGGFELAQKMREHAEKSGAAFVKEQVIKVEAEETKKTVITDQQQYEAKAVMIASGAVYRKLMVPGENRLTGMGVSYCATCDGAFFRNRTTAVVGGGDVALEDALFLARGCEKVYLIHRRDRFRGAKILADKVKENEKIEIIYDTVVQEICGEGMVQEVKLFNKKKQETTSLAVSGVFVAVGMEPKRIEVVPEVETDEQGYIRAGEDGRSSVPGIYAIGDIRTKQLRQVVTAVSDGANAVAALEQDLIYCKGEERIL